MKVSCTQENLTRGLAITSHVSTKNVNLPILNHVLIKSDGGGVQLISTNLEIAVMCNVRGKVEQEGEYTVPSKLLYDFVNLLPNDRVDLDLVDEGLAISCGRTKTKVRGAIAGEFPLVPPAGEGAIYRVSAQALGRALAQVLFSAATNEARPELAGVFMAFTKAGGGLLTLAATDSYRLAERTIQAGGPVDDERSIIVPQRTLAELARIFSVFRDDVEAPDQVEINLSDNQVVFRYGSVQLTSRTIEGPYPDYKQIIPTDTKTKMVLDRAALIQAVKGASLFAKSGLYDVTVRAVPGAGAEVSASDATRGENVMNLEGEVTGAENSAVLNFRYLLDGLGAISSEKVRLELVDGANPCLVLPEGASGEAAEAYRYVVMPIRQ